jgi:HD-GYP domain-containing protein (c-di-GMP phosphodiesterase class II)
MKVACERDPMLYRHSLRVGSLAAAFAAFLGYSSQERQQIVQASLLHDLGKLCLPPTLLNKPGSLSATEVEEMRRHPQIGYAMVGVEVRDGLTLDVILHHHERLDGSGYPHRRRGLEISDPVRVVTICDVYAAMTECRPYGTSLSAQDAIRTMLSMENRIDPMLVSAFARSELWKNNSHRPDPVVPAEAFITALQAPVRILWPAT